MLSLRQPSCIDVAAFVAAPCGTLVTSKYIIIRRALAAVPVNLGCVPAELVKVGGAAAVASGCNISNLLGGIGDPRASRLKGPQEA
eukprot:1800325-Pyramimonas_sp.AAC.1